MKKGFIFIVLSLLVFNVFSAPFNGGEELVRTLLEESKYITYYKDSNNVYFVPMHSIAGIQIDEDKLRFQLIDKDAFGNDDEEISFSVKKYTFDFDEKKNLVIRKK